MAEAGLVSVLEAHIGENIVARTLAGNRLQGDLIAVHTDAIVLSAKAWVVEEDMSRTLVIDNVLIPLAHLVYFHKSAFPYAPGVEPGFSI